MSRNKHIDSIMPAMSIRSAKQDDALVISQLIASLSHYCCEDQNQGLPKWFLETITPQAIAERISSNDFIHYVYLQDNEVVGYIAIQNGNHLYHLFVLDIYQGKGVARRLWEHAICKCLSRKFTVRSSLIAVPVYERLGFKITGPICRNDGIAYQPMEFMA